MKTTKQINRRRLHLPAWDSLEVYGEEDTPQGYTIEESNGVFKVYCDEWRNHGHGLVGWGPTREVAIQIAKTAAEGEASRAARKAAKGK